MYRLRRYERLASDERNEAREAHPRVHDTNEYVLGLISYEDMGRTQTVVVTVFPSLLALGFCPKFIGGYVDAGLVRRRAPGYAKYTNQAASDRARAVVAGTVAACNRAC
jgi:hypothetical protein